MQTIKWTNQDTAKTDIVGAKRGKTQARHDYLLLILIGRCGVTLLQPVTTPLMHNQMKKNKTVFAHFTENQSCTTTSLLYGTHPFCPCRLLNLSPISGLRVCLWRIFIKNAWNETEISNLKQTHTERTSIRRLIAQTTASNDWYQQEGKVRLSWNKIILLNCFTSLNSEAGLNETRWCPLWHPHLPTSRLPYLCKRFFIFIFL